MLPPQRAEDLLELEQLLSWLHRSLRRESHGVSGLTFAQFHLLRLVEKKKATVTELSEALGVTLSSITGLADRLVKCGLVGRARDRADRRVVMISITPRGEEFLSRIQKRRQELIADYFREISDAEITAAVRLFRTVEQTGRMR